VGGTTGDNQQPLLFLVERYLPTASRQAALADAALIVATTDMMAREGARIRFLGSTLVLDDEICFLLFDADNAEDLRRLMERASIPFQHVSHALQIAPDDVTTRTSP